MHIHKHTNKILLTVLAFAVTMALLLLTALTTTAQVDTVPPEALADENGAFVTIDDMQVYYVEAGDPAAPTVMLLHGFGGSTFTWRDTIPVLVEAGYHVVAYDRPPFGLATKQTDLDLSDSAYAEQLAGLMDALDVETAALVGHSAGGGVIARFATEYPERVEALVFAAGAVDTGETVRDDNEESDSPLGDFADIAANLDPENPATQRLIQHLLTPERFTDILADAYHPSFEVTDEIRAGYARVLQVEDWELGLLSIFTGDATREQIDRERLTALDMPVLLIWGIEDTWVPLARGEALQDIFADAALITYEDVGHMPMEETSAAFNQDLIGFLNDLPLE